MKISFSHSYEELVDMENLLEAWQEFLQGKKNKKDVQEFQLRLMDNILSLHRDLINGTYRHGGYKEFKINDPKPRTIHKATVRDRLLHHAIHRSLYSHFDRTFIADSFSSRKKQGIHRALRRFRDFGYIVSKNNTRICWILKCDIKKFFASINQQILVKILNERIPDKKIVGLLKEIIGSFDSGRQGTGLPLGNLTSQLFSNVYLNEFDQFLKHKLKVKYYIRYADDFVIFYDNKAILENAMPHIKNFLRHNLMLMLHPDKVSIKTLASGVDFLGWVHFFNHRVLRTVTKKRMIKNLSGSYNTQRLQSYLGLLSHGNAHKLREKTFKLWVK